MTHLARARGVASLALAALSTLALVGCQGGAAPVEPLDQTTSPQLSGPSETTPEETTVTQTYGSAEGAVAAPREPARQALDEVVAALEPREPTQVERYLNEVTPACTVDTPRPSLPR